MGGMGGVDRLQRLDVARWGDRPVVTTEHTLLSRVSRLLSHYVLDHHMAAEEEMKLPSLDSILFDLDGTLWDVTELVAKARNHATEALGLNHRKFTREDIAKYIGLPVDEIYRIVFPDLSVDVQKKLRALTTEEIARRLPTEGASLYPGVPEGLATLKRSYRLFIVSNCGKGYIENFLNWSGLGPL